MTIKYIYALQSKVFLDFLEKIPIEKIRRWEEKYEIHREKTNEKAAR